MAGFLDPLFLMYRTVKSGGVALTRRAATNFVGALVSDDSTNNQTTVQVTDVGATAGAALTNADATITVAQGAWRTLPAATLTGNHVLTLDTAGAQAGNQITVTRLDATAHTYAVADVNTGTLVTFPVSKIGSATFQYSGTAWALRQVGSL